MATDFNALYKEFLTNISDKKYYSDYMSFLSRGDNYRFSYDNQIIMFVQSGKSFEFHTYNEYIAKGYKPFGPCSVLTYKCFNVNESNRKYWDNSSVIRIGAVSTPNAINENDKYHAEFPLIQNDEVYERLYSSLQKDDVFSHEYDSDADIKNKFKSSISLLTRTLVRNIMKEKDRNVSNNPLVTEDNIASAIEYTLKAKLGIANEDDFGRLANPFSNTEGTPDRKIVDTYFFALNNCLKEIEGPIYQCFIRNKASITEGYEMKGNLLVLSDSEPELKKEDENDLRGNEGETEERRLGEERASDGGRAEDTSGRVGEVQGGEDEVRRQARVPGSLPDGVYRGFGLLGADKGGRAASPTDTDIQPSDSINHLGDSSGLQPSSNEQRSDELSLRMHGREFEPELERSGENDARGEMEVLLRDGILQSRGQGERPEQTDGADSGLRGLQLSVSESGNGSVVSGQRPELRDGNDNGNHTADDSVQVLQGDGSVRQVYGSGSKIASEQGEASIRVPRDSVPSRSDGDGRSEEGVRPSATSIHDGGNGEAVRSSEVNEDYSDKLRADSSGQLSFDFVGINEAEKRKKVDSFLDDVESGSFIPKYDSNEESIRNNIFNNPQYINYYEFVRYDINSQLSFLREEPNYTGYTYQGFVRDIMSNRKNTSDFNYVRTSDNKVVPTFLASALLAGTCYQGDKIAIADYFISNIRGFNTDTCEYLIRKYNGKGKGFVYTDLNGDRRFGFFIPSDFPYQADDVSKYEQSGLFIGRYEPSEDDGRMIFKKAFVSWKYIAFGLDHMVHDINSYQHIPLFDKDSVDKKFLGYDDCPSYFNHNTDEFKDYIKYSREKLIVFYKHKKQFDGLSSDSLVSDLSYNHQEQLCSDYLSNEAYVPYAVISSKLYSPLGEKLKISDLKNPKNKHDGELLYIAMVVPNYHIPMKVGDVVSIHEKDGSESYYYCNPSADGTTLYDKVNDSFFLLTLEETYFLRRFIDPEDTRYQIDVYQISDEHDAEIINSINDKLGDKQLTGLVGNLLNALIDKVSEYYNKSFKTNANESDVNEELKDIQDSLNYSANDSFKEQIDKFYNHFENSDLYNAFKISDTTDILLALGLSQLPILYTKKHFLDAIHPEEEGSSHYHGLSLPIFYQIPDELQKPLIVLDSLTQNNSIVIVTSLFDSHNRPIIVSLRPNGKGFYQDIEVFSNFATSIYGRNGFDNFINRASEEDKILCINYDLLEKRKELDISSSAVLQLLLRVENPSSSYLNIQHYSDSVNKDIVIFHKSRNIVSDIDAEKGINNDNIIDSTIKKEEIVDNEKIGNQQDVINNIEETKTDSDTISDSETINNKPIVSENRSEGGFYDKVSYFLYDNSEEQNIVRDSLSLEDVVKGYREYADRRDNSFTTYIADSEVVNEIVSDNVSDDSSDDAVSDNDVISDDGGEISTDDIETSYYTYPSNFKSPSGIKNRLAKNITAIKVLKEIRHRPATREEQQALSEYTGFGGLQLVFDERAEAYENERAELKELLSKEEYRSAQSSIMDAFYTPKEVIDSVYECLEKMGFKGGKVLDPSMGVGRFYSFMPKEMRDNSELYGVEIDSTTEKIAALLNPDCKSYNLPFEDSDVIYDSAKKKPFDLIISNIPFGELRIKDHDFKKAYRIHDYFFMKALSLVKEGGIVAFITSTGTLDKLDTKMRDEVYRQADLVASYRLPNNIFSNTSVSSDIIFLQKGRSDRTISEAMFRSPDAEDYGFRNVLANDYGIAYNNYYFNHPDMLLGRMENSGRFGGSVCVPFLEGTFEEHFHSNVLPNIPENIVADVEITKEETVSEEVQVADKEKDNKKTSDDSDIVVHETEDDFHFTPYDKHKSDTANSLELGDEIPYNEVKENINPDDIPYLEVNPGALFVYSGKIYRRQTQSEYSPCYRVIPSFVKRTKYVFKNFKSWEKKAVKLINLRNSYRKLVYLELNDSLEEDIEAERRNLNKLYNDFVVKYGFLSQPNQIRGFDTENFDLNSQLFTALERTDKFTDENGEDKEKIVKADIFDKRQYTAYIPPVHAESIEDALNITYVEKNGIDFDRISSLLDGMDKDEIIEKLKGQIFKDPETYTPSRPYEGYVIKEDYLSGNVREKLNTARSKASAFEETDPHIFDDNIEALEKALPKDIPAEDIAVDIGAPWIEPQDYRRFMSELTHTDINKFDVKYFELTATYYVENKNGGTYDSVFKSEECRSVYGTQFMNFYKIFENLLNQRPIKIEIKNKNYYGNEYVLQKESFEATTYAKQKADEIKDRFKDWIFRDADRREKYVRIYNDKFNSTVLRHYDGSYMEFPGINSSIHLYDYQKDGISMCIRGGNTLLAYCVGAGKSFMMIASAMEMKRLGLCRKSLIVVPKATVPQMYAEFKRLYPNSEALMITSGNFTKKKRAQFLANVALGNYDAIIMSHDQFNMVKLSSERRREYITSEIEQLQEYLQNVKNEDNTERFTIRQIEKEIEKLQLNLEKVESTSTDTIFTFEELGVDALFLDEAHNYKNMYFATKLSNISGVQTSASERSLNLSFILQYLAEVNHGYKNVIFATGTPVSNSMSEMYNFTKYLRPDLLKASGLYAFDAWASTFGDVTHNLEPKPDGNGFQFKDRFAKFKNLPELTTMYRSFADVKLLSDIKDHLDKMPKLKNGKPTIIKCEPNDIIKAAMKEFSERSVKVHSNGFIAQKGEDNYLKIIGDGRKLSVDTQLYLPSAPEYEGSKLNACVREVFRIWNETSSFRGTQAIFLDAGVPNGNSYVNLYQKIKDKLIALGVPSEEIAFVQDYGDEKKKDALMANLNAGNIRVVLGSTQTLGTGCNFQERLYAIHELDAPWTPASVEQREGRIIRQGNNNPEVEIYRYIMQDTFDTFNWTTLDRKKDFIDQSISGTFEGRDVEDAEMTASYADIKQACTTNPYIQKKFENDNRISILSAQKKGYQSNIYRTQTELKNIPTYMKMYKENISDYEKDIEARDRYKEELTRKIAAYNEKCEDPKKKIAPSETPFEITIGDTTYYNRKEANDKITKIFEAMENGDQKTIGKYYGFNVVASRECMDKGNANGYINYSLSIRGATSYTANFEISNKEGKGNMMKLQNQLLKMEEYKEKNEKMLSDTIEKEKVLREQVDKPFEGEAELQQCLKDKQEFEMRINEFEAEHATEEEDYSYIDLEQYKIIPEDDRIIDEKEDIEAPAGVHDISIPSDVPTVEDVEKLSDEKAVVEGNEPHNEEVEEVAVSNKEETAENDKIDDDFTEYDVITQNTRK